jgi:membrane carboxypeptidase/penicillin-binding protein PbpC
MRTVKVCADTGLPATQWCPHTATETLPASQFTNRRCDVHYPLAREEGGVTQRWPVSAKGWDLAKVTATENVIAGDASRKEGLRIIAPTNNSEFVLASEPNADKIRLRSSVDASADVNWYLDGQHLGSSGPANRLFIDLTEGTHTLTCMAASGATDSATYTVATPGANSAFRESWR